MFELGKVGIPMILLGYAYILFVGRLFLPKNESTATTVFSREEKYLSELVIADHSNWIGKEIDGLIFERDFDLELVEVLRAGESLETVGGKENFLPVIFR